MTQSLAQTWTLFDRIRNDKLHVTRTEVHPFTGTLSAYNGTVYLLSIAQDGTVTYRAPLSPDLMSILTTPERT